MWSFLAQNWIWLVFAVLMVLMHRGHGGHGGHSQAPKDLRDDLDAPEERKHGDGTRSRPRA